MSIFADQWLLTRVANRPYTPVFCANPTACLFRRHKLPARGLCTHNEQQQLLTILNCSSMFNKMNHYDFLVNPVCSLQSFLRIWGRYGGKLFYIGVDHARCAFQSHFWL